MSQVTFDLTTIDWKVIIGAVALLVTIFAVVYFQWWRNRKRLSYDIVSSTPLLTTSDEIKNDLQILYKGEPVKNVHLIIIKVINDGSQPIKKDDFEDEVNFDFSESTEFLSYEVVKTSPKNLKVMPLKIVSNKLSIEPLLLNSTDYFEIKLLLSTERISIKPNARIVGVKAFKRKGDYIRNTVLSKLIWPIAGCAAAIVLFNLPIANMGYRIFFFVLATLTMLVSLIHLTATVYFVINERRYNQD